MYSVFAYHVCRKNPDKSRLMRSFTLLQSGHPTERAAFTSPS